MPNSHHRAKHKQQHGHHPQPGQHAAHPPKSKTRAALVMTVIGGLVGIAIAYFANNESSVWMIAGLAFGALAGYFFGSSMDRSFRNK